MSDVEPGLVQQYADEGVVVIRGLFADWVDTLREGVDKNIANPSPLVRDYTDKGGGRFFGDYCSWSRITEYREFLFDSGIADIALALMGGREARLFHEHVLVKEANTDIATPWHHDQPYYCVDGARNCSLWLALDPVPKSNSVEFIRGSHQWGKWYKPERFDRTPLYQRDDSEMLPDIEANRDDYDIVSWSLEPGDVVAFHFLTLHGAPPNRSQSQRRRGFSSRWIGDDATFAVRKGKTSPPFSQCKLNHGDAIDGAEFPVISRR